MAERDDVVEILGSLALFADLSQPQLEEAAHTFEEEMYPDGQRVLRQGFAGTSFHLILDGDAAIVIDGTERARLGRGDYFGEISMLLDEPPTADVVAVGPLRCLTLPPAELEEFLLDHPKVMFRMLQAEARRLRISIQWQS